MFSSTELKRIISEIRPIIERQLDDAELIAGFRKTVADQGGDWSALKGLVKAQIKDERDEAGDGKHVRAILERAEYSSVYADMLGWANMNEQNFSSDDSNPAAPPPHEGARAGEADGGSLPVRTVSPINSNPAVTAAREAGSTGEGDAGTVTALPAIHGAAQACDEPDLPAFLDRRGHA